MTKQERIDMEKSFDQKERDIAATHRLAAATERLADAQEVTAGYRTKPLVALPDPTLVAVPVTPL